jgi:hypothetical protein
VFWLQYLLKKLCLNTFFVIQFAGFWLFSNHFQWCCQ